MTLQMVTSLLIVNTQTREVTSIYCCFFGLMGDEIIPVYRECQKQKGRNWVRQAA